MVYKGHGDVLGRYKSKLMRGHRDNLAIVHVTNEYHQSRILLYIIMNLCTSRLPIRTIPRLRGTIILNIVQINTSGPQAQYELLINSQVLSTKKI